MSNIEYFLNHNSNQMLSNDPPMYTTRQILAVSIAKGKRLIAVIDRLHIATCAHTCIILVM